MGNKAQPVNACLFTLLKRMIIREQTESYSATLTDKDYGDIAEVTYGVKTKTSFLKRYVFFEGDKAKFTYKQTTLDDLVKFLKPRFGYKNFEDFSNEFIDDSLVKEFQNKTKLFKKDLFKGENDRINEWVKNKCRELFSNKQEDLVTRLQSFNLDDASRLVDSLIDEYSKMMKQRTSVHQLLIQLATNNTEYCLSLVQEELSSEQFLWVGEILEYYKKVSIYYERNRLNIPYLCDGDPIQIKYWYNTHLKKLFQNERNPSWGSLKEQILKLQGLFPEIERSETSKLLTQTQPILEPQITTSSSELEIELRRLDSFIDFSFDKPDSYYVMKAHRTKAYNLLSQAQQLGLRKLNVYSLRGKLADFLYLTGDKDEALKLRNLNYSLLPYLFEQGSKKYNEEESLLLHKISGWQGFNKNQVDYCKETWGELSVQSFKALTCRACLLIKAELYEEAKSVIKECERIKNHKDFDIRELPKRNYHLDMQYGKILYFEATKHRLDRDNIKSLLEIAIGHFNKALNNYIATNSKHTSKNYAHYYLFECYKLLGLEREMKTHYDEFSKFFLHHPVSTMCQVDSELLRKAIRQR